MMVDREELKDEADKQVSEVLTKRGASAALGDGRLRGVEGWGW